MLKWILLILAGILVLSIISILLYIDDKKYKDYWKKQVKEYEEWELENNKRR